MCKKKVFIVYLRMGFEGIYQKRRNNKMQEVGEQDMSLIHHTKAFHADGIREGDVANIPIDLVGNMLVL